MSRQREASAVTAGAHEREGGREGARGRSPTPTSPSLSISVVFVHLPHSAEQSQTLISCGLTLIGTLPQTFQCGSPLQLLWGRSQQPLGATTGIPHCFDRTQKLRWIPAATQAQCFFFVVCSNWPCRGLFPIPTLVSDFRERPNTPTRWPNTVLPFAQWGAWKYGRHRDGAKENDTQE